jgi:uncharacterized protein involved in exopolysaccharide biosynthesis
LIGTSSNLPTSSSEVQPTAVPFSFPEEEEAGAGFTLMQVWCMLRAHLILTIGIFAVLMSLAYMAIKKMPRSYDASAALIVNNENTDPLAGRTYTSGQTGSFFPTQVELIYNSVMLQPVIDKLQLQYDRDFNGGYKGDPKTLNDIVLGSLRNSLGVKPGPGGSQMLYIGARASSPEMAAKLANAVADEYLSQSRKRINAPAIERADRYSAQLAELKEKSEALDAKLRDFRERNDMVDLKDGGNNDSEGATLAELESQLRAEQNARRQLEARIGDPNGQGAATLDGQEVLGLRAKLGQLEGELTTLRATYGPRHPVITSKQAEIDETRASLESNASTSLVRARELETKLQTAVSDAREKLLARRKVQDQASKILLEAQLAKNAYADALRGLDPVQFASTADYKDVSLVSRAEPPVKASKPNKMKLFLLAFLAAAGLAVGGPFAYELLLDRRIRCRDDLERGFRITTLAQFGRMSLPA